MRDPGMQSKFKFLLLAAAMAALWLLAAPSVPSADERALWDRVRSAQLHIAQWRTLNGIATPQEQDPNG